MALVISSAFGGRGSRAGLAGLAGMPPGFWPGPPGLSDPSAAGRPLFPLAALSNSGGIGSAPLILKDSKNVFASSQPGFMRTPAAMREYKRMQPARQVR